MTLHNTSEKEFLATALRRLVNKGWKKIPRCQLMELRQAGYIAAIGGGFLVTDKGDRLLKQVR